MQSANHSTIYHREECRIATFKKWGWYKDCLFSPLLVAAAGFHYKKGEGFTEQDRTKKGTLVCHWCNLRICPSLFSDSVKTSPYDIHAITSPDCPFVNNRDTAGNIGYGAPEPPACANPVFKDYEVRLKSFFAWSKKDVVLPSDLASAGFYCFEPGTNDKVKCFKCDIMVLNWTPGDDPLNEHKRWNGNCDYLKTLEQVIGKPVDVPIDRIQCDSIGRDYILKKRRERLLRRI